jgi:hypothetical protein
MLTDNNSVIKLTKEFLYIMKATGIVRRTDDWVIIGTKSEIVAIWYLR